MKCKYCGADNVNQEERCFSCNAPLPKRSNLSEQEKKGLSNYITSVENMLKKAKKKADGKTFFVFTLLSLVWMASSFLMYRSFAENDMKLVIIFAVIFGLVLFLVFGASITLFENKAMENVFNSKIKHDIREYLQEMKYTAADFQNVAGEVLKEKSPLNNFLADI